MPRRLAEAFVLRTWPIGETDLLVTFVTPDDGRVSAVARSARRSLKRFGAALEPLTRVTARWQEFDADRLARLDSCDILRSYVEEQRDLRLFGLFAYISEVAGIWSRDHEPDPRFFRLIGAAAEAAAGRPEQGPVAPRAVRRYFDLWTLRLQGVLPDLSRCSGCGGARENIGGRVNLDDGELLCDDCAAGAAGARGQVTQATQVIRLRAGELAAARRALREPVSRCAAALAPPGLRGLDTLVRRTMLRFTEQPLRSLPFLVEIEAAP